MDLADSAFHFGFRWEALPPFAHRLEKNALSLKSLLHIRHLLPSQPNEHQCPRQELNLVLDLRRVACESGTPQGQTRGDQASPRSFSSDTYRPGSACLTASFGSSLP